MGEHLEKLQKAIHLPPQATRHHHRPRTAPQGAKQLHRPQNPSVIREDDGQLNASG